MFKCEKCNHLFNNDEKKEWIETYYEEHPNIRSYLTGCPICKGDYIEVKPCKICNEYYIEEELHGGVCNDCISKYRYNFKVCNDISCGEDTEIKINSLLAEIFDKSDIEAILESFIHNTLHDEIDCNSFIIQDKDWFGEKLFQEINKK